MAEEKKAWDKQPEETGRAYNAFLAYRNMGVLRSLQKAAGIFYNVENISENSGKVRGFYKWSSKYNWVARCEAYDIEQGNLFQIEQREAIREMNIRQASYGLTMQKKGITRLLDMDVKELTPDQAARLTKTGVEIERPARGEATEISEHKGEIGIKVIEIRTQKRKD